MKLNKIKISGRFSSGNIIVIVVCIFFSVLLQGSISEHGKQDEKSLFLFDKVYKGEGNPSVVNIKKIEKYTLDLLAQSEDIAISRPLSSFAEESSFPKEKDLISSREYASYNRIGYAYLHYFSKNNVSLYIYELRIFNRKKKKFFSYCAFFKWPHEFKPAVQKLLNNIVLPSCSGEINSVKNKIDANDTATDEKIFTVLIDPGHGGHNLGAVLPKSLLKYQVNEKDLNSVLARLVGNRLEKMGFSVHYTRIPEEDYFLSLEERANISNVSNPDLFISLHHDGGNPGSHGFRLFYSDYKPLADVEDLEIFLGKEFESDQFLGEILINDLSHLFYRDKNGEITYTTSKLSNWDVFDKSLSPSAIVSKDLGDKIVKNFIKELTYVKPHPRKGHHARKGYHAIPSAYFVLRKTRCPSILIENGYMTTPDEFLKVSKPENQRLFAQSLTDSIFSYFYPHKPLPVIDKTLEDASQEG